MESAISVRDESAISVRDLNKEFKTYRKEEGLISSAASLLRRNYETKRAVVDMNFEIDRGETVGYIGPNGAGKSTTIKMLTGILKPTSGEVNCLGYDPWDQRLDYVKRIGVIFGQKSQLYWDLPAIDTYHLLKDIYSVPDNVFEERLSYLIKTMRIDDFKEKPVRNLSLGERMKCEFVASFLHRPEIVFLDEPTIGLDLVSKEFVREFIRRINSKEGTTIVLTTHDMGDVEEICDRIILIDKGRKVYDGPIKGIKDDIMDKKEVEVVFEEPVRDLLVPDGCSIVESGKYKAAIKVDLKEASVSEAVSFLLNNYKVTDLNIGEMPVEDVIRKIYEEGL